MFVWIIKMLQYDRIDISEGIDINKTKVSKECKICRYWYFKDIGFKDEPHFIMYISKDDEINIMNNSSLIDKKGVL